MPDIAGPQAAHQGRLRVAFAGDSLGFYEGEYALGTNPPYFIDNGAAPGCGFTNGGTLLPWSQPDRGVHQPNRLLPVGPAGAVADGALPP